MATYLIVSLGTSNGLIDSAVQQKIAREDTHQLESGKWLISSTRVTSKEVSDLLQIEESAIFLVTPVRGYYGRAASDVWEWLSAKSKVYA